MNSSDIRKTFIDFFKSKAHDFIPASPITPENDPTLLFINAGMNQFKPYFLGKEIPSFKRAVNSQPCIRVSGKHNDLEDVGLDTYHHTSFEMLGNWSFGDYYKKDTIIWAWELLTEYYRLPKQHLIATVYEDDDEAYELWRTCTDIKTDHIVRCGKKDNFWEMGATGPCGPCSEIHIDQFPELGGPIQQDVKTKGLTNRYMELWNLVFIQYNRSIDGTLINLPEKHIDTGAGLERLAALLQNVPSNYDTDCFQPIINEISGILNIDYSNDTKGIPHRVISDHIRTVSFAIADNVIPSNEGRGYVLRRLIRRALRFASQAGHGKPFLFKLIPIVSDVLGQHYTHITERLDFISDLVKSEEEQFLKTVASGLTLFHQMSDKLKQKKQTEIPGKLAFKLYDTYGFPIDLTQVMANEKKLSVDLNGFNNALEEQRQRSRSARNETLNNAKDDRIEVISKQIKNVHQGLYIDHPGGGEARIPANDAQRFGIAQHHSATHLLHASLRKILGNTVLQAGSLVDINRLRFDFNYGKSPTKKEVFEIENFVNQLILENYPITISEEATKDAKAKGAIAMFGEKYGDTVRVVDIQNVSMECCGGNHIKTTGDCEIFKIISESAIAAGTRRIEAIVGNERLAKYNKNQITNLYNEYDKKHRDISNKLEKNLSITITLPDKLNIEMVNSETLIAAIENLQSISKTIEKNMQKNQQQVADNLLMDLLSTTIKLKSHQGQGVFAFVEDQPIPVLRNLADKMMQKLGGSIILLGSVSSNKGHAIAKISDSLTPFVNAKDLINELTAITGGGGGGNLTMAQAGGLQQDKLKEGILQIKRNHVES